MDIKKVVVIGSGTMGSGIADQVANAGIPVFLLDLPSNEGSRNKIVENAKERILNSMIKNFLKKIYISKLFSKFSNFIGSPWKGKGAILMYHRVLPDKKIDEDLNLGLAVSCSSFEKQIRAIKEKFKICSINEFVDNLRSEKNEFMLAITFDDGYKDNLLYALPILE